MALYMYVHICAYHSNATLHTQLLFVWVLILNCILFLCLNNQLYFAGLLLIKNIVLLNLLAELKWGLLSIVLYTLLKGQCVGIVYPIASEEI